jgi:hypothetical protein
MNALSTMPVPGKVHPFVFLPPVFEPGTGRAVFRFSFGAHDFEEIIDFGAPDHPVPDANHQALQKALALLSVAIGISYFKAFLPAQTTGTRLAAAAARFFDTFYRDGLAELAHRNHIPLSSAPLFAGNQDSAAPQNLSLSSRALVMVGGGKDSLVSVEILRAAQKNITLFAVNPALPIRECIFRSGLPACVVTRKIDPRLFALNEQGAYNGHVPITGIISFISIAAALIHDYREIVVSNERSASEPTVGDANHQYSKSLAFEKDFQNLLATQISADLNYFSFLRPFSELQIAQIFSRIEKYDDVFTSCNKAYSVTRPMTDKRWCGECPKCQFVFLALATAISPDRMVRIFGKNLLEDESQLDGFRELSGLSGHKPWECVGEILESASALHHLSTRPEWKAAAIVKTLKPELEARYGADVLVKSYAQALTPSSTHAMPKNYKDILDRHVV